MTDINDPCVTIDRMVDAYCKGDLPTLNRLYQDERSMGRELSVTSEHSLDMVPVEGNIHFVAIQDCTLRLGSNLARSWIRRSVLDSGTVNDGSLTFNWAPLRLGAEDALEDMLAVLDIPFPTIEFI